MNVQKGCADYLNTSTPTVMSTLQQEGYSVGHYGKWHVGDNPADQNAGIRAAPSPRAYGVTKSRCYVCNPDNPKDPSTFYDVGDMWFPSNSSRLIVDDALTHISTAQREGTPFYLNMWFHISHAPLLPTPKQYNAYAAWLNGGQVSARASPALIHPRPRARCPIKAPAVCATALPSTAAISPRARPWCIAPASSKRTRRSVG